MRHPDDAAWSTSFAQDVILRDSAIPKVAQTEVFPRGNSILSNSVIPKVAQNGVLVEGFALPNLLGVSQFAQNDVLVDGFRAFGMIFANLKYAPAEVP